MSVVYKFESRVLLISLTFFSSLYLCTYMYVLYSESIFNNEIINILTIID